MIKNSLVLVGNMKDMAVETKKGAEMLAMMKFPYSPRYGESVLRVRKLHMEHQKRHRKDDFFKSRKFKRNKEYISQMRVLKEKKSVPDKQGNPVRCHVVASYRHRGKKLIRVNHYFSEGGYNYIRTLTVKKKAAATA